MTTYCHKCGGVNGVTADAVATNAERCQRLELSADRVLQELCKGTVNICDTVNSTCTANTMQWCMCKKLEGLADQRSHPAY